MKFIGYIFATIFLLISYAYAIEEPFIDIDSHWAKEDIKTLYRDGNISGYSDGSFKPNNPIRVDEFLKIIISECSLKLYRQGENWSQTYAYAALDHGLILDGDFESFDRPILRHEAAKIMANFINIEDVQKAKNSFTDLSKENKDTILKIVSLDVMSGYKDKTFRENSEVTRAQACKIILNGIKVKHQLAKNRKYKLTHTNTNIGLAESGDIVKDVRYKINNNRIYIYDSGRYSNSDWMTLNQEYINDSKIIKLINCLIDDFSYVELIYVPDKHIINSLNVCYGRREGYVNNGNYSFFFRFYENGFYNVSKSTGIDEFSENAFMMIQIDRLWDNLSEFDNDTSSNDYRKYRLEEAIGVALDKSIKKEFIKYIDEKIIEAKSKEDNEFEDKIVEVKKIGKYTINTLCTRGTTLQFYIEKP